VPKERENQLGQVNRRVAARGGIPVIASMAGPLRTGIKIAEKLGLTLICFVRGRRMNVYTHPERVVFNRINH